MNYLEKFLETLFFFLVNNNLFEKLVSLSEVAIIIDEIHEVPFLSFSVPYFYLLSCD